MINKIKNQRGSLTVDYLFAFFLVSGFCLVIMTFSATLSTVEIVQYMTFAAARNFFAGNKNLNAQKAAAEKKFGSLKSNPVIAPLLNGGWFSVDEFHADYDVGSKGVFTFAGSASERYPSDPRINLFHGVFVALHAKILDFQVPFFGSTSGDGSSKDNKKGGFKTYITSFLGREVTFDECNSFNKQRWEHIKLLPTTGKSYSAANEGNVVIINDNGC